MNPQLLNPLAIGAALGGQLLNLMAPRPKLRAGYTREFSLLSQRTVTRTVPGAVEAQGFVGLSVAGGSRIQIIRIHPARGIVESTV